MSTTPASTTTTGTAKGRTPARNCHARRSKPRDSRPRSYSHRAPAPTSTSADLSLRRTRDTLVGEEDMTGTVREYLYAGGEAPTAMRSRNSDGSYSNFFFVTNTHGDVVALTDKDGNVVNRYAYGPWGEATRVSEQVHQPFRYAGYRYEDGFDLYYLRARWMDPNTGRFLSRDPLRGNPMKPITLNRYAYARCSPSTLTDASGLSPTCKRGITALASIVDSMASIYVRNNTREELNQFVDAMGFHIVGWAPWQLSSGPPEAFGMGQNRDRPERGPLQLGTYGWAETDDPNPAHHLIAFLVSGYKLWGWSPWLYETHLSDNGTVEDIALGDVGVDLGNRLRTGALLARDLGSEILRLLMSSEGPCYRPKLTRHWVSGPNAGGYEEIADYPDTSRWR
ncbi:MAG: hypothetical protein DCC49_13445 [Acidobacteria bacterium]|nr:MAG: hypothetical protein DCC49_13445 [Acidobacteriota bacterium]